MASLKSMTAYALAKNTNQYGQVEISIRSVNSRFLDVSVSSIDPLLNIEQIASDTIKKSIQRGKVECSISFTVSKDSSIALNHNQLKALQEAHQQISQYLTTQPPSFLDVLNFPGVVQNNQTNSEALYQLAIKTLQQALEEFEKNRALEGNNLSLALKEKLQQIDNILVHVKSFLDNLVLEEHNRLQKKIELLTISIDPERIAQEVTLLASKQDIAEEYDRICSHVSIVKSILDGEENLVGKRLDFMMQELARESNTIASKVNNQKLKMLAVELKVLIEQMREQVQNIE